jgi:hypothetical protein
MAVNALTTARVPARVVMQVTPELIAVDDVGPALMDLVDSFALNPIGTQGAPGSIRGHEVITESHKHAGFRHHIPLVCLLEGQQHGARARQAHVRRLVGLEQGRA